MRAVILNLFLINLIFAQSYKIEGEILDASNKSALPFANVILEGTTLGSASDANGKFSIEKINAGTYTIIASYMGYSTIKTPVTVPSDDGIITILLEPEAIQLDEYVVTASRRRERIEDAPAACLLYTSPSPRDGLLSRMPSSA